MSAKQLQDNLGMTTTVELKYPVRLPTGETLDKLTLRRVKVGDLRAVSRIENEAEQGLAILARITGLVPEDLDLLDLEDLNALQDTFRANPPPDAKEAGKRILHSAADMARWFGWSVQDVYDLDLEEFEDWMNEITRQIKAGYRKGI